MRILFRDAQLVSPDVELEGASVLIEDGVIRRIYPCGDPLPEADRIVDVQGDLLVPGFIDIHTHGRSGQDFSYGTPEAIRTLATDKLREGATTILPTTSTQSEEVLSRALQCAADLSGRGIRKGAGFLACIWKGCSSIRSVSERRIRRFCGIRILRRFCV